MRLQGLCSAALRPLHQVGARGKGALSRARGRPGRRRLVHPRSHRNAPAGAEGRRGGTRCRVTHRCPGVGPTQRPLETLRGAGAARSDAAPSPLRAKRAAPAQGFRRRAQRKRRHSAQPSTAHGSSGAGTESRGRLSETEPRRRPASPCPHLPAPGPMGRRRPGLQAPRPAPHPGPRPALTQRGHRARFEEQAVPAAARLQQDAAPRVQSPEQPQPLAQGHGARPPAPAATRRGFRARSSRRQGSSRRPAPPRRRPGQVRGAARAQRSPRGAARPCPRPSPRPRLEGAMVAAGRRRCHTFPAGGGPARGRRSRTLFAPPPFMGSPGSRGGGARRRPTRLPLLSTCAATLDESLALALPWLPCGEAGS